MHKIFDIDIQKYVNPALRVGVSLIFIWFGMQQLTHPSSWTSFIPDFLVSWTGISVWTFVALNGAFEVVFAFCLIAGFYTRISALHLALHMLVITIVVGYNATGVRDFGVFLASMAVFANGIDKYCLDRVMEKFEFEDAISTSIAKTS